MPAQCRVEVYRGPCADTSVDLSCSRVESEIMLAVRLVAVARVLRESRRCLATHLCDKCCSFASRVKLVDVDLELDFVVNSISNLPNQFQFQFQVPRSNPSSVFQSRCGRRLSRGSCGELSSSDSGGIAVGRFCDVDKLHGVLGGVGGNQSHENVRETKQQQLRQLARHRTQHQPDDRRGEQHCNQNKTMHTSVKK